MRTFVRQRKNSIKTEKMSSIAKTKDYLVDVAQRLFAQYGKTNVTMNDIATESQKGRRTLYTYFSNKDDIYLAVIKNELAILREKLEEVTNKDIPPDEKLTEYIFVRQNAIKDAILRNGSLHADFFRDIYEVQRARRRIDVIEHKIIKKIFDDGVAQNIFEIEDTNLASLIFLYSLKGIETPFTQKKISNYIEKRHEQIMKAIFYGIKTSPKKSV